DARLILRVAAQFDFRICVDRFDSADGLAREVDVLCRQKLRVGHFSQACDRVKSRDLSGVEKQPAVGKLAIEDHRRHHTSVEGDAAADTDRLNTDALRVPQREVNAIEDADFRRRKAARVYDRVDRKSTRLNSSHVAISY